MLTDQEIRKIRLKNDYKEMQNLRGDIINWRVLKGTPPYVEKYELTISVKTIISPEPTYRSKHVIHVTLPSKYPDDPPEVIMQSSPQPFHPNWWPNSLWCGGDWFISEALGHHIIRMIRTLQYDHEITNPKSAANQKANEWYLKNIKSNLFPCDTQILPDPTKGRFIIQSKQKKKFIINT